MSRVAIVTGGAQGIGAAIAHRLASEGDAVAVFDWNGEAAERTVEAITAAGGTALAVTVDVSDPDQVSAGVDSVRSSLGAPTILINNAGIIRDNLLFRMTLADWDSVMGVHLRGAFLMSQAVQGYMTEARFGRIINISSISALGNRGQANYAAAKAGLQDFTKTLSIELGKFGITVNAVAPGYTVTNMIEETAARVSKSVDELVAEWMPAIPVGRAGTPEDVANAVAFFTGDAAGFVSGQVLYVAGGPYA